MAQPDEDIINLAVAELHRIYDHVSNSYDQLRIKALALIVGEVAVVTFLFSGNFPAPLVLYGVIFYAIGIAALVASFCVFLWTISALRWAIPVEFKEIENIEKYTDKKSFLNYIKKDYLIAIEDCMAAVEKRVQRFDWGLYLLLFGVIILMVIKFGGTKL